MIPDSISPSSSKVNTLTRSRLPTMEFVLMNRGVASKSQVMLVSGTTACQDLEIAEKGIQLDLDLPGGSVR